MYRLQLRRNSRFINLFNHLIKLQRIQQKSPGNIPRRSNRLKSLPIENYCISVYGFSEERFQYFFCALLSKFNCSFFLGIVFQLFLKLGLSGGKVAYCKLIENVFGLFGILY